MKLSNKQKWLIRGRRKTSWISPKNHTRAMLTLSTTTLNQIRSLPEVGPELHEFLLMLGEYMRADLHQKPLTTDQSTSITIDDTISEPEWKLVQVAVGHGLLHPNVGSGNTDEMPWKEGAFHLAYSLAPHFRLLPRRGKAAKLTEIRKFHAMAPKEQEAFIKYGHKQSYLFDKGDMS